MRNDITTIATGDAHATTTTGVYDVSRWRPIKPERFLEELGNAGYTLAEGGDLRVSCDSLPDTRQRQVLWAEVKPLDFQGVTAVEPYLMLLYGVEDARLTAFERTDVNLAIIDG